MLGYYEAWEEAERLQEQWQQQPTSSASSSLRQEARDAASLMDIAGDLHTENEEYDMFTDQLEWEAMEQEKGVKMEEESTNQCQFAQQVKQEIDDSEKAEAANPGFDVRDWLKEKLVDKFLQDALTERVAGDPQKHDENASVEGSKAKSCPMPPPVKAEAQCTNEPKKVPELAPLPPPKELPPPPLPPPQDGSLPRQERVRGFAGPEHEGSYYVPGLVKFIFFLVCAVVCFVGDYTCVFS